MQEANDAMSRINKNPVLSLTVFFGNFESFVSKMKKKTMENISFDWNTRIVLKFAVIK